MQKVVSASKLISTSEWREEHPFAARNIQHTVQKKGDIFSQMLHFIIYVHNIASQCLYF